MPLVAHLGARRIEAPDVSAGDWLELKASYRQTGLVLVCGHSGFPKTSQLGTQYFSHFSNSECQAFEGGRESPEHLAAKAAVAKAARAAGWTATIEHPAPDRSWIADVLIEEDGRRIALEVQLASQTDAEFTRRTSRYAQAGIETIWLVNARNSQAASTAPHYLLEATPETGAHTLTLPLRIARAPELVELEKAIDLVLNDRILEYMEVRTTALLIGSVMQKCWVESCGRWISPWYLAGVQAETRCGEVVSITSGAGFGAWQTERIETRVEDQVRVAFEASDRPRATFLRERYSKTKGLKYAAHNCPYCGNMQGDGFIVNGFPDWAQFVVPVAVAIPIDLKVLSQPHHCEDIGHGLCSQKAIRPRAKSLVGRVTLGSLTDDYELLPPKDPERWKNKRPSRARQAGSHRRQPQTKAPKPDPTLTRESNSLDHVFEARWAVLEPLCNRRPVRRFSDPNRPIAEMTREQLWRELDFAVMDLEAGRVQQLSAQRRSENRPDNLRELLGELYPDGEP